MYRSRGNLNTPEAVTPQREQNLQDLRNVNVNRVTTQDFNIQTGPLDEPMSARTAIIQNNT